MPCDDVSQVHIDNGTVSALAEEVVDVLVQDPNFDNLNESGHRDEGILEISQPIKPISCSAQSSCDEAI